MNAKELILSKINCGDNLAKCYLYSLMLGFDIKDVVSFMTSPCVNLVNDLTESNMMDSYVTSVNLNSAINMADGRVDPTPFLNRSILVDTDTGKKLIPLYTDLLSKLRNILKTELKEFLEKNLIKISNLKIMDLLLMYIKDRTMNSESTLKSLEHYYPRNYDMRVFSDYVEKLIYQIKESLKEYKNPLDYEKDLEELKKLVKFANETTALGGAFLGMNQGLTPSKAEFQKHINMLKAPFETLEKEFGIYKNSFSLYEAKDIKNKREKINKIIQTLKNHNPLQAHNVEDTIKEAIGLGLIQNFDIEKWLLNSELTESDIINDSYFYDLKITADDVFQKDDNGNYIPIKYRDAVARYYNIIKETWNIYDIMNKVPQYNAILDLLLFQYVMDKSMSIKSNLFNLIVEQLPNRKYLKELDFNRINSYINDLLISAFFNDNTFTYLIEEGESYINEIYENIIASEDTYINLNTPHGRASFKKAFERKIIELRKKYPKNRVLADLNPIYDKYNTPTLALGIDMMKTSATINTLRIYLEYLDGIEQLKGEKLGDYNIADLLTLYNLFVHKNQYGSDRLTKIFKNVISDLKSIMFDYFRYISDKDYGKPDEDLLKTLGYNLDDILIRLAPFVSLEAKYRLQNKAKYIRTINSEGLTVIEKLNSKGEYYELPIFPSKDLTNVDENILSEEQKDNYKKHLMIKLYNNNFSIALSSGLLSRDANTIINTLYRYIRKGLLILEPENC